MVRVETIRQQRVRISIIVPVLNEERTIAATLKSLASLAVREVIVVDGGSSDRTRETVARTPATLASSPSPRSRQMNHGANLASGEILLFLHADTRLPSSAVNDICLALRDPQCVGGRFDVKLDSAGWRFQMIGRLINLRSRWTKVGTGDQAIFVRREVFDGMGGFPDIPLMEDIAFSRALKRQGKVACLRSEVVTSSRRWEMEGVLLTVLKMWAMRVLFLAGVSPIYLKRFYRDTR